MKVAKSASPSCILRKKTSTATNPPLNDGRPSRLPRPSCSPSSACSHHPTMSHLQTSRPANNGARIRLHLRRRSESASETLRRVLGTSWDTTSLSATQGVHCEPGAHWSISWLFFSLCSFLRCIGVVYVGSFSSLTTTIIALHRLFSIGRLLI